MDGGGFDGFGGEAGDDGGDGGGVGGDGDEVVEDEHGVGGAGHADDEGAAALRVGAVEAAGAEPRRKVVKLD